MRLFLIPLVWFLATASLPAATGSAETGDVTVDSRSNNADLSALTLSSGTIDPGFDAATTSYSASVSIITSSITATPTVAGSNATLEVRINDGSFSSLVSGQASNSLSLNVGSNTLEIRVTAENTTTKTYTVMVTRAKTAQTITFDSPGDRFISEVLTLAATGGGSTSGLVFEVVDGPGVITGGNELSFTGGGSVTVRASQAGDALHDDANPVERTFGVLLPRPDVAVGRAPSSLMGSLIYSPRLQLASLVSSKARPVTGHLALGNRVVLPDDRAADAIVLRGGGGNTYFKLAYFAPTGNVTAAVLAGTYQTPMIDGDDSPVLLRAMVTPNKKKLAMKNEKGTAILKKTLVLLITASSSTDPAIKDAATIRVQTR